MPRKSIIVLAVLLVFLGCAETANPDEFQPFFDLANSRTHCADIRNDLYSIDDQYVLWVVEGNCADASYLYALYGATVDDLLCNDQDSIGGLQRSCPEEHNGLFTTLVANLDDPALGLASDHTVVQIK